MVSFSCENCGDVLTKKKLDPHRNQCRGASYTCLDCMVHFHGTEYRSHTSCISEAQKYQGNLYKEKKGKSNAQHKRDNSSASNNGAATKKSLNGASAAADDDTVHDNSQALVPRGTYLEETYISTAVAIVDAPPEAPEPPPNVNVFDYLLPNGEDDEWESDRDDDYDMRPEPSSKYNPHHYPVNGFEYGSTPVSAAFDRFESTSKLPRTDRSNGDFVTPAAKKGHSRNISIDSTGAKKSGKRKRGQPEGLDLSKSSDIVMTDVPPNTLHSGLTGGMNRLLSNRHGFPPSPDLSGDGKSPPSPIKRSRADKENRREKKPRRKSDSDREDKRKKSKRDENTTTKRDRNGNPLWERRRTRKRSASPAASHTSPNGHLPKKQQLKAIEYPTGHGSSNGSAEDMSRALVKVEHQLEHAPTTRSVGMFLDCLVKGSETDEGVSVWKALKRWRRDGGHGEKDLWKGLKVRQNDNGELVLCV